VLGAQQSGRACRAARWVLPAALLAASLATPAFAAAQRNLAPTLTGTTVVTANASSYATVRLAKPLQPFDYASVIDVPAQISVSDPAHFVGVALVAQKVINDAPPGHHIWVHPTLLVASLPNGSGGYRYEFTGAEVPRSADGVSPGAYAPGNYWLFVLATGPERVTWHLPLPGGTRTLRASHPAMMSTTLNTSPGPEPGKAVVPMALAYGHAKIGPLAEVWALSWTHGTNLKFVEGDSCLYDGTDPVANATAPLPAFVCDGGTEGGDAPGNYPDDIVSTNMVPFDAAQKLNVYLMPDVGLKNSDEVVGQVQWTAGRDIWLTLPV